MDLQTTTVARFAIVPFQANCLHWFCGNCIVLVWEHESSSSEPCKCPLCRRQITVLVPGEASIWECHNPEVSEIWGKVETYNGLSGCRSSGRIWFGFGYIGRALLFLNFDREALIRWIASNYTSSCD